MAAKQGLTAQIHQYSEDTKRSLLSRAPAGIKSHSWLSNLNTTCTIKSAPPRTPEVMSMLGTKCGWLAKRNEQHVWQKRWCCVVPHTFLYYFEASPVEVKAPDDSDDHGNGMTTTEAWSGGGINVAIFANIDQEALNAAVKEGYEENGGGDRGGGSSRMSLYPSLPNIMGGGGGNAGGNSPPNGEGHHGGPGGPEDMVEWDPETAAVNNLMSPGGGGGDGDNAKGTYAFISSNLQPVGIIDLECYSAVNRSKINPTVLELAGDSVTNPDLRSFYFQSPSVEDAESWTKALLSDRHSSLKDETDAYRQVCESFPLQLANCSQMIDTAERKAEEMEREAYSVRSASEEGRRKVVGAVREVLERRCWETESSRRKTREERSVVGGRRDKKKRGHFFVDDSPGSERDGQSSVGGDRGIEESKSTCKDENLRSVLDAQYEKLETNRVAFLRELEAALSSPSAVATSNVVPPVQTLVDYTTAIATSVADLRSQLQKYEMDLSTSVKQDQSQLEALRGAIEGRDARLADAEEKHRAVESDMRSELDASRRREEELAKQLEAQRMEFGMYQNATKTKLGELQQHKKILKREVIELRKRIDECGSENTTVAHEYEKLRSSHDSMKDKNATLERYISRLEKQVGVQQNMMELMSQGGGASFVGKIVGPGVTQNESKDAISLSGMSMGSQYRRIGSTQSMGGGLATPHGGGAGEVPSTSHSSLKPRPLLPPESRGGRNNSAQDLGSGRSNLHDVSPLPTPRIPSSAAAGGLDGMFQRKVSKGDLVPADGDDHAEQGEDDRDPSTAYYRSDTTTEADDISPGSEDDENIGDVAMPSPKKTPGRSKQQRLQSDDVSGAGSPSIQDDPILSTRSGENTAGAASMSPRTPDDRSHDSIRAQRSDASKTPVQSNSFMEDSASFVDKVIRDSYESSDKGLKNIPSLDTNGENMDSILNVNASASGDNDEKVKVVSLNDSLLEGTKDLQSADSPDDDEDDNASRVSDITEDRTQRQIDDDLAERRKILLAYVNKTAAGSSVSLSNASAQRKLETIESMLPPKREDADGSQKQSSAYSGTAGSGGDGSDGRPRRLSVAQRARLDAESRSNTHRTPSPKAREAAKVGDPIRGKSPLMARPADSSSSHRSGMFDRFRGDASVSSIRGGSVRGPSGSSEDADTPSSLSVGRSGSFWGKIGKVVEKAVDNSVLGVGLPADETYDDSMYDESESEVMSSVVSEASTTLAERIAMQRERQVAFLKNKGLIEGDGKSLRGGAGVASPARGNPGSPNSSAPTPRQRLGSRWAASRRGVNVTQGDT